MKSVIKKPLIPATLIPLKIAVLLIAQLFLVSLVTAQDLKGLPIDELNKKADDGDAKAMYEQARRYHYGIGVDKDLKKARFSLLDAAEAGLPEAQYVLGQYYINGINVKLDKGKGYRWILKAAVQEYAKAEQLILDEQMIENTLDISAYMTENLDISHFNKFLEYDENWFRRSGLTRMQVWLGLAAKVSRRAKSDHDLQVAYYYGWLRVVGEQGRRTDNEEHKHGGEYIAIAANGGHVEANELLCISFLNGYSNAEQKKNFHDFRKIYNLKIDLRVVKSGLLTWEAYTGWGPNFDAAISHARRAAEEGSLLGQAFLGECLGRFSQPDDKKLLEKHRKEGLALLTEAAKINHPRAMWVLATIYGDEKLAAEHGVSVNKEKETSYYIKAVELNDKLSINEIGPRYYRGIGTKRDFEKAYTCLYITKLLKKGNDQTEEYLEGCTTRLDDEALISKLKSEAELQFALLTQPEEIKEIIKLAGAGDAHAQLVLAMAYHHKTYAKHLNVRLNKQISTGWLNKYLNNKDLPEDNFCFKYHQGIAQIYKIGGPFKGDYKKSAEAFFEATKSKKIELDRVGQIVIAKTKRDARQLHAYCYEVLAGFYQEGRGGLDRDLKKSVELRQKKYEVMGTLGAALTAANSFLDGTNGFPQDKRLAIKWWIVCAVLSEKGLAGAFDINTKLAADLTKRLQAKIPNWETIRDEMSEAAVLVAKEMNEKKLIEAVNQKKTYSFFD